MTTTDEVVFPAADEIEGYWALDKMHTPRPITPLSFDLVVRPLAEGFTKAQSEYDCPIMVTTKEVNHYFYVSFHPIPDDDEIQRRMVNYHDKLARQVPLIGKTWEEEWKPAVIAQNVPLKTADWASLSDADMVAKLDELTDHMRQQWWIHGHINFVLLSSSAFCDLYDKVMKPDESTESYRTLPGLPHTLGRRPPRHVGAQPDGARRPDAEGAVRDEAGPELLDALDETDEGRDFRRQLDEFLFEYGWRSDAVYDLADVPWREDPSIPLLSIRAMMDQDESEDPEVQYQENVAAREGLLAKLRETLADDPETQAKFDELYEAARYSFPLTEDHAFYIDQLYISVFRRFVLAVGDRLVAKDVIDAADDVFFLYRDDGRRPVHGRFRPPWQRGRAAGELPACRRGEPADGARHAAATAGRSPTRSWTPSCSGCSAWSRPRRAPTRTPSRPSPGHRVCTPARRACAARSPRPSTTSKRAR